MLRFQAPPNWPQPPDGWTPTDGWQPDLQWGPAPAGWHFWLDDGSGTPPGEHMDEETAGLAAGIHAQVRTVAQSGGRRVRELLQDQRVTAAATRVKRLSRDERTQKAAAALAIAGVGIAVAALKQAGHSHLGSALELGADAARQSSPKITPLRPAYESPPHARPVGQGCSTTPDQTYESMRNLMNTLHTSQVGMLQNFTTPFDEWQQRR